MHNEQAEAVRVVQRVLDGATLTAALNQRGDDRRGQTLVQELAYGTLRHWGTLDALARRLATKPFTDAPLSVLVPVALYQLDHTRAPPFAVVDRAVEAAGMLVRPGAKGLVNAILRRYLRERDALQAAVAVDPVARWSYPRWWIARVRADFPEQWEAILAAGNTRPPLSLRVNLRATTRAALLESFAAAGIVAHAEGETGVIVAAPRPVQELPGFDQGAFAVQDLGAQLAAPLLDLQDGQRVLDACAAPGGKTTHILELADVALTALDVDAARLSRVRDNLARLRHADRNVSVVAGDAADPAAWWDGLPFDRILADVPCTASGIVRRHPDGKWLRRAGDVASFARAQDRLLDAMWTMLAPGGALLYATCSVFRAENDTRIDDFLLRQPDALRESLTFSTDIAHVGGQLLPCAEGKGHNQDGFFYALLRKA